MVSEAYSVPRRGSEQRPRFALGDLGAKVVARAWSDAVFKKHRLKDTRTALLDCGIDIGTSADFATVANTPDVHNLIVCLVLVLPEGAAGNPARPVQAPCLAVANRGRSARLLSDFGVELPPQVEARVARFDHRLALPCAAGAAQGDAGLERGAACRHCHVRLHDRHGAAEGGGKRARGARRATRTVLVR
jgi:hypothetical protein